MWAQVLREGALRAPVRGSGGQGVRERGKLWPPPQAASPREGCWEKAGMPLTFGIEVLGATTPLIPHAWGQGGKRKGEGAVEGGGGGGRQQEKEKQGGKRKREGGKGERGRGGDSGDKGGKGASRTERRKQISSRPSMGA